MAGHLTVLAIQPGERRIPSHTASARAAEARGEGSILPSSAKDSRETSRKAGDAMREWPYEIVRILDNWAMWLSNDRRPVSSITFPAYSMAARGKRAGNIMPILGVEAEKADAIIRAMTPRYQQPIRMHYCWQLRSVRSRALACNCAVNTYYTRLDEAHELFVSAWYVRRAKVAID